LKSNKTHNKEHILKSSTFTKPESPSTIGGFRIGSKQTLSFQNMQFLEINMIAVRKLDYQQ
jgi:hypothetical protein